MRRVFPSTLAALLLALVGCGEPADVPPVAPAWAKLATEQVQAAKTHGVPPAFENELGMRFVLIPGGTFVMGSPADEAGRDELETPHRVTLTHPYYVQTTEVTNRQYRRFRPQHDSHAVRGQSLNGDEQPVVHVSWSDAVAFAAWLSERDGVRTYRLPTEAEWERACRAGTQTAYWWGATASPEMACYDDGPSTDGRPAGDKLRVPVDVGSLPASPWGLHEVHGNVREWCLDAYADDPYGSEPVQDPLGRDGDSRGTRGGAFGEHPDMLRAAWRIGVQGNDERRSYVGFRLVVPLAQTNGDARNKRR
ncbi:MAG: formylglycine-generating enzyme family protein [Planctomycetes bacterium]|nr:formylglycine-generating enzyme family protein [Planctomycetota bacterium]